MNFVPQFVALLRMGLEGDGMRIGSVLTILVGVTCTVAVLVAMLAMGTGAHQQAIGDVRDDEVVIHTKGSGVVQSNISRDEALAVRDLAGIAADKDGRLRIDNQVLAPIEGRRRGTGRRVSFPLFGTTDPALEEPARLTDGRMFRPGLHELVVTNACIRQFDGFGLGAKREVRGLDWTIVGHFDRRQNLQCLVLTDSETLMTAFGRNGFNQINIRLRSPSDFEGFRRALEANPSLKLEAKRARDSVEEQFKQFNGLLNFVSYFIGTITAIGATFGAVNSLYSIVDSRRREIATLRAIGFGGAPVVAATIVESVLLALPGAFIGATLAWLLFQGMAVSPFGFNFRLEVTLRLAEIGIAWALVMGLIGGLLPALRAARVPVTTALRAT